MKKDSPKLVRFTAAQAPKPAKAHLDRLKKLGPGIPDDENPEWTQEMFDRAAARKSWVLDLNVEPESHGEFKIKMAINRDIAGQLPAFSKDMLKGLINQALQNAVANATLASKGTSSKSKLPSKKKTASRRSVRVG